MIKTYRTHTKVPGHLRIMMIVIIVMMVSYCREIIKHGGNGSPVTFADEKGPARRGPKVARKWNTIKTSAAPNWIISKCPSKIFGIFSGSDVFYAPSLPNTADVKYAAAARTFISITTPPCTPYNYRHYPRIVFLFFLNFFFDFIINSNLLR